MKRSLKTAAAAIASAAILTGCALARTTASAQASRTSASAALTAEESAVLTTELDVEVSSRDASGEVDTSEAVTISPGDDLTITSAGVYILSGTYTDQMLVVAAGDEDKVQIVLDGVTMTNSAGPVIYVQNADKVFLTALEGTENTLSDGSDYEVIDGDEQLDAAVFSCDDLTVNGSGTITVNGNYKHGIASKDDLVITISDLQVAAVNVGLRGKDCVKLSGATVTVTAGTDGIRSDNGTDADRGYVSVVDSTLTVTAAKDGIQAENSFLSENSHISVTSGGGYSAASSNKGFGPFAGTWSGTDDSAESYKGIEAGISIQISGGSISVSSADDALHTNGTVLISSGSLKLASGDDGIHADEKITITGGTLDITASEAIEATYVLITGGDITITASDDGINAARKSTAYTPTVEITGGNITITMGAGDTDGIDSNGNILISGGTVSVSGSSAFDYDGTASLSGGTVYVNGQQVTAITNQFMGGGMGGFGGMGGQNGGNGWGGGPGGQSDGFGGGPGGHH